MFGLDALDPLLWQETTYLLTNPSHQQSVTVLDEFLRSHGETQVSDPLKRAFLQNHLWAVFDWTAERQRWGKYPQECRELQIRLAEIIRRVALTPAEISALPDFYNLALASGEFSRAYDAALRDTAFLPPDLTERTGDWVTLTAGFDPVAPIHVASLSGRSSFRVFMHLPGGRKATLEYLQTLWSVPNPSDGDDTDLSENHKVPQFPPGTAVAILRQMNLVDSTGAIVPTPIIESLQLRVYRTVPERRGRNGSDLPAARNEQDFFEIRLSPKQLMEAKTGGLKTITPSDTELATFQTHGMDPFEVQASQSKPIKADPILGHCVSCHSAAGINSVQTRRLLLKPRLPLVYPPDGHEPRQHFENTAFWDYLQGFWWNHSDAVQRKGGQYDWGLLKGYWLASESFR